VGTVEALQAVVSMGEAVLEVASMVEGLAATTAAMGALAGGLTGDSAGRVEWEAGLSAAQADIPASDAGSPAEEPGLAMEWHPMHESLTASGMASVGWLAERALRPATLPLWVDGVWAPADGVEVGVIRAGDGVGAVGDWALAGDWGGGGRVGAGVGIHSGIGRRIGMAPGDRGTGIPGMFTIIRTEIICCARTVVGAPLSAFCARGWGF
jgi:hypothetical protein